MVLANGAIVFDSASPASRNAAKSAGYGEFLDWANFAGR